eukprot:g43928.t1
MLYETVPKSALGLTDVGEATSGATDTVDQVTEVTEDDMLDGRVYVAGPNEACSEMVELVTHMEVLWSKRIPEGPIDQGPGAAGRVRELEEQLIKAKEQIEIYKKQPGNGPGKEHEELRRKIENGVKELWFFVQSEIKKVKHLQGEEAQRHADALLENLGHQQ